MKADGNRRTLVRILLGAVGVVGCLFGQTPAAPPAFEVAAIQPTPPPPEGGVALGRFRQTPGGIDYYSISIYDLIRRAYGIKSYELSAPAGLGEKKWNIVAHAPAGATPEQIPLMVQTLLAERFKLKVHREPREISAYALVVAKGGPKLKQVPPPEGGLGGSRSPSGGIILKGHVSLDLLANALSLTMGRPVADFTGMPGIYEIAVEYMPDQPAGGAGADGGLAASLPGMAMADAVEKTLGLKLEPRKLTVQMLIVDHVERQPTPN